MERVKRGSIFVLVSVCYLFFAVVMTWADPEDEGLESSTFHEEIHTEVPSSSQQVEPSTQVPTSPTEPSVEPTQPSTEPTQPSTEPTQPSTEPTQPSIEPTQPSTEPTQPSIEPTQPSTEPTQEHQHEYVLYSVKEATCTEEGETVFRCSCGQSQVEMVPALGHTLVQKTVEATYSEVGFIETSCSLCGYVRQRIEVPALGLDKTTFQKVETSEKGIKIFWTSVPGAEGYVVYQKDENGLWKDLATVQGEHHTEYIDSNVKEGKTYTYTVRAYIINQGFIKWGKIEPKGVTVFMDKEVTVFQLVQMMRILWQKNGCQIYTRAENGRWANQESNLIYMANWRNKTATGEKKAIQAMKIPVAEETVQSPVLLELQALKQDVILRWNTVNGVHGYCIERRSEDGTWSEIAEISEKETSTWTDQNLALEVKYQYRIRAYMELDGVRKYSDYSNESYMIKIRLLSEN